MKKMEVNNGASCGFIYIANIKEQIMIGNIKIFYFILLLFFSLPSHNNPFKIN